jgi:hypothetical protein
MLSVVPVAPAPAATTVYVLPLILKEPILLDDPIYVLVQVAFASGAVTASPSAREAHRADSLRGFMGRNLAFL